MNSYPFNKISGIKDLDYGKIANKNSPNISNIDGLDLSKYLDINRFVFDSKITQYQNYKDTNIIKKISEFYNLDPRLIKLTPGSEKGIDYTLKLLLNDSVCANLFIPNFPRTIFLSKFYTTRLSLTKVFNQDDLVENISIDHKSNVFILTYPIIPLSNNFEFEEFKYFLENKKDCFFILDLSLISFEKSELNLFLKLAETNKNLILLISFSKLIGLPGLRFGLLINSNKEFLDSFDKISSAFDLTTLTLKVIEVLIDTQFENIINERFTQLKLNYNLLSNEDIRLGNYIAPLNFIPLNETFINNLSTHFTFNTNKDYLGLENLPGIRISLLNKNFNAFLEYYKNKM